MIRQTLHNGSDKPSLCFQVNWDSLRPENELYVSSEHKTFNKIIDSVISHNIFFYLSVLRVAPLPVFHWSNTAHHSDADGERACVDGRLPGRGLPALPPQVDRKPIQAVHEPKIKATVTLKC